MQLRYKTIVTESSGIYKNKGSKFISFALPVQTVERAKELIQHFKSTYYDARHVCYAYVIGPERDIFRVNDDGEPTGTAGKPILGQLNSFEITNVLVVVVRYFGGVLLGTGGLIVAYREATIDALKNATFVELEVKSALELNFEYILLNEVMSVCKFYNIDIIDQSFDNTCSMKVNVARAIESIVIEKLSKISGLTLKF